MGISRSESIDIDYENTIQNHFMHIQNLCTQKWEEFSVEKEKLFSDMHERYKIAYQEYEEWNFGNCVICIDEMLKILEDLSSQNKWVDHITHDEYIKIKWHLSTLAIYIEFIDSHWGKGKDNLMQRKLLDVLDDEGGIT